MINSFGERLKSLREKHGWSQTELCKQAKRYGGQITKSAVSQMETGATKSAHPENLFALAQALGVDPGFLGTGKPYYPQDYNSDIARVVRDLSEMSETKQALAAMVVDRLRDLSDDDLIGTGLGLLPQERTR